ncbi:hypothetical protein R5R35_003449 [Gryllus longicercus]|uniref:CCHC-type domain-containing protein n=1 Tax=Gryllus longicercus TaxID=2509291 RepID=A0AAN9VSA9_9ORTH
MAAERTLGAPISNDTGETVTPSLGEIVDRQLEIMLALLENMRRATHRQKNVSMEIKDSISRLEESVDIIRESRLHEVVPMTNTLDQGDEGSIANEQEDANGVTDSIGEPQKEEDNWTEVRRKKKKPPKNARAGRGQKEKKKAKARTNAVLIKPSEGKAYAEVIGALRSKISPEDENVEVRGIRKTRDGNVLVELGNQSHECKTFRKIVQEALGEACDVRNLTPQARLEIRDLDCLTTEEEVRLAIQRETNADPNELKVTVLQPNSREQRLAIVEMEEAVATPLLYKQRVKIGWVNCRVGRRIDVPRCYKCLDYGHVKKDCKGPDRSDLCWKCGKAGHKHNECQNRPACVLCATRSGARADHTPGTGVCRAFREALEQKRIATSRK